MRICLSQLVAVAAWSLASGSDSPTRAVDVHVIRIDGTTRTGTWIGSADATKFELRGQSGTTTLRFDETSEITFRGAKVQTPAQDAPEVPPPDANPVEGEKEPTAEASPPIGIPAVFYLADGGRLFGLLLEPHSPNDSLTCRTSIGDPVELPFEFLAGVELAGRQDFPRAQEVFHAAMTSRRPGKDVLVTREVHEPPTDFAQPTDAAPGAQEPKSLPGRLATLGPLDGSFVFSDRTRSFRTERAYGIVFAAGASAPIPARRGAPEHGMRRDHPITLELLDGSVFTCRVERSDAQSLHVSTSWGFTAELNLTQVVRMSVESDRVVYLTDLKPVDTTVTGLLHRPWPPRFDKSVAGGPILIDGRKFDRGLGVHSRTQLLYDINKTFETFVATIGLDDFVRPRGSVVFRVLGDSETLYDSGVISGKDDPVVVRVDVANVKRLGLVVDYGEELDLADHADWGDARLLRPPVHTNERTH